MAEFENRDNYGTQTVNRGVMIVQSNSVEEAIKLKQKIDEMKRRAREQEAKSAEIVDVEFTEVKEAEPQPKNNTPAGEEHPIPDAMTLVRTNIVISMEVNAKYVRFDKLYEFIRDYFVSRKPAKYDWYALFHFLYEKNIITTVKKTDFAKHMKQPEWFGYLDKEHLPTADAIGDYNYLFGKDYHSWEQIDRHTNSKANPTGLRSILACYINLDVNYNEDDILEPKKR